MIKRWNVLAQAFNRKTGMTIQNSGVEEVSTENTIFTNCVSIMDVKKKYESFWNDLNPESEHVVFVQQITPIE